MVVQQLTDFIWIGGDPYSKTRLMRTMRILASLGKGIDELNEFYRELPYRPQKDLHRLSPFLWQYSVRELVVKFTYKAYLMRKTLESHSNSKTVFLATIHTEDRESQLLS